jgi:predicted DNA-binding transcriptional regulator AlpA
MNAKRLKVRKKPSINAPLAPPPMGVRLLDKHEVCEIVGVSYPTLWAWMRAQKFPRSRVAGRGSSRWLSTEVDAWLASLPLRRLKGDDDERGDAA